MAFWGHKFIFDGIPCETFDLMMYDIGGTEQGEGRFANTVTIIEEGVGNRWRPLFYGVKYENKQELEIVFGVNVERIDRQQYLDRYEIEAISSWLCGRENYCWLEIEQADMEYVRYRCMVTGLEQISYGNIPWAFRATITCDSPFAYMYPQEFRYDVDGSVDILFFNESSINGLYLPEMEISISSGDSFSIENLTDDGRIVQFSGLPADITTIHVDNENGVLSTPSGSNVYPYFNFKFLRLKRGYNTLRITGNGSLLIRCEFPVSTGG